MGKLNRKAVFSSAMTAGLLLTSATATSAADPPAHSKAGGSAKARARSADGRATPPAHQGDAQNASGSEARQANSTSGRETATENRAAATENRSAAADNRAEKANQVDDNPRGGNHGNDDPGAGNQGRGGGGARAARTAPAGNNGTIKVDKDAVGLDRRNNEPRGGCQGVTIKFFNFDPNEVINVSFRGQAPTRFGGSATRTVTADGNGYTTSHFSFAEIVPAGAPASKNGGWHVKVQANGVNHPAGVKKKVFWLRCAASGTTTTTVPGTTTTTVPGTTTTTVPGTTTTTVPGTTTTTVPGTTTTTVPGTTTTTVAPTTTTTSTTTTTTVPVTTTTVAGGGTADVGGNDQVQNQASATTPITSRVAVLGEVIERTRAAEVAGTQDSVAAAPSTAGVNADSAARVLGTTAERGALARTGLNTLELLAMGAISVLTGIAAVRASRRKQEEVETPRFVI